MTLVTTRTSLCFGGWLLKVLARLQPVELEICVCFRVAVVPRAMYTAREAGDHIYKILVSTLVSLFFIFVENEEFVKI
jgi:hypothetical protein